MIVRSSVQSLARWWALRSLTGTPLRGARFVGTLDQPLFFSELNEYCTAARCTGLSDASNAPAAEAALAVNESRGATLATASHFDSGRATVATAALLTVETFPAPAGEAANSASAPATTIPTRSPGT